MNWTPQAILDQLAVVRSQRSQLERKVGDLADSLDSLVAENECLKQNLDATRQRLESAYDALARHQQEDRR